MILDGLKPLYQSMREQGIERYKFEHRHGRAIFDVFFFIDESPFVLLFGVCGHNLSFELPVFKGFRVESYLDSESYEIYKKLCQILDLQSNPNNPFSTRAFLEEFNKHIPYHASSKNKAQPHEIIQYRRDVEELDQIYFYGWHDNKIHNHKVRPENLEKTQKILGVKAYERCKYKNISSRWTDNPELMQEFYLPD